MASLLDLACDIPPHSFEIVFLFDPFQGLIDYREGVSHSVAVLQKPDKVDSMGGVLRLALDRRSESFLGKNIVTVE